MSNHRITDGQATALLDGRAPEGRDDLQDIAALVDTLRLASFEPPPLPNAALAARLDLERLAWVSATRGTGAPDAERTAVPLQRPAKGRTRTALGWFTGLGIAAQLALGAGAVSASAAGIGMAGALPPAAQEAFDTVVATVTHADELFGGGAVNAEPDRAPDQQADDASGDGGAGNGSAGSDSRGPLRDDSDSPVNGGGSPDAGKPDKAEKTDRTEKPEKGEKPAQAQKPAQSANGKPARDDDTVSGGEPRVTSPGKGTGAQKSAEKNGSIGSNPVDKDKPAKESAAD